MVKLENRRYAVERILEDEALTAALSDDAAALLLKWGRARAKAMTQQAEELSSAELDARLTALRRRMKYIGRQAGRAAPEAQVERVRALLAEVVMERDVEAENGA